MKTIKKFIKLIQFKYQLRKLTDKREYYPDLNMSNVDEFTFEEINEIIELDFEISEYKQLINECI